MDQRPGRARRLAGPVAAAAGALGAAAYLRVVDPYAPGGYPPCPLFALTGLYCAGCGSLRAGHELMHLDVGAALALNPLLLVVLPVVVAGWFAWARRAVTGAPRSTVLPRWLPWTVLVVVVAYTVLRNVPALAPWLAP